MISLPPCQIVTVVGPVASGKTHLLKQWLSTQDRFVCFDTTGEMLEQHGVQQVFASPRQLLNHILVTPFHYRISYVPGRSLQEDFNWCVKIMWQFEGVKLLAVDESHLIFPNNAIEDQTEMLLRFARHAKLGLVCMTQRIADIHKLLLSSSRTVVLFKTRDGRSYEAIRSYYGQDVADRVSRLRPLIHDDSTQTTKQVPQCMVITQTEGARVYDFATGTYLDSKSDNGETSRDSDSSEGEVPSEEGTSDEHEHNESSSEGL